MAPRSILNQIIALNAHSYGRPLSRDWPNQKDNNFSD